MANSDKIDALVSTVHKLNHEVRPKVNDVPGGDPPGNPLHLALGELRDHEARMSLVVRSLTIADLPGRTEHEQSVDELGVDKVSSRRLLASFGTARESILSIIRTMDDSAWDRERETTEGSTTVTKIVDDLIESDKVLAEKVLNATK